MAVKKIWNIRRKPPTCIKCLTSFIKGATSGAGTAYPFEAPDFTPVFSGVRVTRSLVLCVCFVDRCLSFCTFTFGHCDVCSSSIYGFWLPLWYLQTLLSTQSCIEYTSPWPGIELTTVTLTMVGTDFRCICWQWDKLIVYEDLNSTTKRSPPQTPWPIHNVHDFHAWYFSLYTL